MTVDNFIEPSHRTCAPTIDSPLRRGRRAVTLIVAALALTLAVAACGSKSSGSSSSAAGATTSAAATSAPISHSKTKFVLHAGLALGAFHHFIYLPFKAGDFSHPLLHKLTVVKAGLAAVYVYHELGLALTDAQADKTLSKLVSPITALQNKIDSVKSDITGGHVNAGDINSANGLTGSVSSLAAGAGQSITQVVPSSL